MPDVGYLLKVLAVMVAATFPCRAFPFLVPRRWRDNPHLHAIGDTLPAAIMLLLVVFCLKDTRFNVPPYGAPELLSLSVVVAVHLWRRNVLLSIGSGTGLYVFLVQTRALERSLFNS